ncbi:MAG: phosphopentomutase [spirochete symbiont of Stewartia floridana]|nr:MAG: phosphopentomutase [spirochete symbiont of Stewartia floridana]
MRVFLIVIDSFGIGELPDAGKYGDEGANTAAGIAAALGGVHWPNLRRMGLGNAAALLGREIQGCAPEMATSAKFGAMCERSPGKDTTTGHWEMAGIELTEPFHIFPSRAPSFPDGLTAEFIAKTGVPGILGNKAASGTDIIRELGDEHIRTGMPICYTSADSVFQIAAHSNIFPKGELYRLCEIARGLCDPYRVGRVIARPFTGKSGSFTRTGDRHDWSIELPDKSLLDHLQSQSVQTVAIGKIGAIFNEQGIDLSCHDAGNPACMERSLAVAADEHADNQFVFINLVDTDMIYGHRRDSRGYHDAVAEIDSFLPELEAKLKTGDVIIVSADHGCDPTFKGTDHTREHVPVLFRIIGQALHSADVNSLGVRRSFADVSASVQCLFGKAVKGPGKSFVEMSVS